MYLFTDVGIYTPICPDGVTTGFDNYLPLVKHQTVS